MLLRLLILFAFWFVLFLTIFLDDYFKMRGCNNGVRLFTWKDSAIDALIMSTIVFIVLFWPMIIGMLTIEHTRFD